MSKFNYTTYNWEGFDPYTGDYFTRHTPKVIHVKTDDPVEYLDYLNDQLDDNEKYWDLIRNAGQNKISSFKQFHNLNDDAITFSSPNYDLHTKYFSDLVDKKIIHNVKSLQEHSKQYGEKIASDIIQNYEKKLQSIKYENERPQRELKEKEAKLKHQEWERQQHIEYLDKVKKFNCWSVGKTDDEVYNEAIRIFKHENYFGIELNRVQSIIHARRAKKEIITTKSLMFSFLTIAHAAPLFLGRFGVGLSLLIIIAFTIISISTAICERNYYYHFFVPLMVGVVTITFINIQIGENDWSPLLMIPSYILCLIMTIGYFKKTDKYFLAGIHN